MPLMETLRCPALYSFALVRPALCYLTNGTAIPSLIVFGEQATACATVYYSLMASYAFELLSFATAFVPSEAACFASSPGSSRRHAV